MPEPFTPTPFIRALPKAELHLHLEGSVDAETLLDLRQRSGVKPANPADVARIFDYHDFTGFLFAFKTITEHLRTADDYELITYKLLERLRDENVRYAEITVSAGVILLRRLDLASVLQGLERARSRGERDFGVSVNWIFDAVRQFGTDHAWQVAKEAVRYRDRGVVAYGIGGDERLAPPELFRDIYAFCAQQGLRLTAHAGETTGPESIRGALDSLRVERIGHGLTACQDEALVARLAAEQVPLEICVTSNLCTGCCKAAHLHPLRSYFDRGCLVTLSTDDPALFRTCLSREYQFAQQVFGFTNAELKQLAANSFLASFLPEERKRAFLAEVEAAHLGLTS
jgi:adenosine deaminase/aminodeoxyfutalosine deaminase